MPISQWKCNYCDFVDKSRDVVEEHEEAHCFEIPIVYDKNNDETAAATLKMYPPNLNDTMIMEISNSPESERQYTRVYRIDPAYFSELIANLDEGIVFNLETGQSEGEED